MSHMAAIHASAKQLGQSEDDRRALMRNIVGKTSCKDMNPRELAAVRVHYDVLIAKLSAPAGTAPAKRATKRPQRPAPIPENLSMVKRIRAQLISLNKKPDSYADGIAQQMFGEAAPRFYEWAHADQLYKISAALGVQQRREGAPTQ